MTITIPENNYKIKPGDYTINEIVNLLRENKNKPAVIQFIADMMEV
jgi:hypothetical protein